MTYLGANKIEFDRVFLSEEKIGHLNPKASIQFNHLFYLEHDIICSDEDKLLTFTPAVQADTSQAITIKELIENLYPSRFSYPHPSRYTPSPDLSGMGTYCPSEKKPPSKNPEYKPNYHEWAARDRWHTVKTACLFSNLEPDLLEFESISDKWKHPANYQLKIKPIEDIIKDWFHLSAHPFAWINKALEKKFPIPPELLLNAVKDIFLNSHRANSKLKDFYFFLAEECGLNRDRSDCIMAVANTPSQDDVEQFISERTDLARKSTSKISETHELIKSENNIDENLKNIIANESVENRAERINEQAKEIYKEYRQSNKKKPTKDIIAKSIYEKEQQIYQSLGKIQPSVATYKKEFIVHRK